MDMGAKASTVNLWGGLQEGWAYMRTLARVMRPARFSVLVFLLGSIALFVDQGQQVLISLGSIADGSPGSRILFLAAVTVWALNCWYGARVMLYFKFGGVIRMGDPGPLDRKDPRIKWLHRNAPRILGALCYAAVAAALGVAQKEFTWLVVACLLLGVLFQLFVWKRRKLLERWMKDSKGKIRQPDEQFETLGDIPWTTWAAIGLTFAVGGATFAASLASPAWPMSIGFDPAVILLLAIATWVPAGSFVVYLARKNQLPILTIIFLFAVLFSFWNDNHEVRTCGGDGEACGGNTSPDSRPSLDDAFAAWNSHSEKIMPGEKAARPLVIIATAGGGSRAAYWTATVLGDIHRRAANFDDHLFAISGVSGGSLGAVVYRALLEEGVPEENLGDQARTILGEDFLAPARAGMLYPDLTQRFWPFVWFPDRAEALEKGWEKAWQDAVRNENLAKPYLSLWGEDGSENASWTGPAVLLNGTHAESGKRIITSNLRIGAAAFDDAIDLYDVIGKDVPMSTAANLSARFPFVQPGGTLYFDCQRLRQLANGAGDAGLPLALMRKDLVDDCSSGGSVEWGRVVDGGYFENYGAVTADQLVTHLAVASGDRQGLPKNVRLIVIQISSDPEIGSFGDPVTPTELGEPIGFAPELRTPPKALLSARTARGTLAMRTLKRRVETISTENGGAAQFFHFRMCEIVGRDSPPLGWVLTGDAKKLIEKDFMTECGNGDRLDALVKLLLQPNADP